MWHRKILFLIFVSLWIIESKFWSHILLDSGSSSMSNTEINTVDEDDVCESYKMRETTKKRKLTPIQLCLLEESFEEDKRLEPDRKLWLAEKLGLQPTQVAVWFQNRRARFKTRQLELDCDSLKASYAKLKTDRDILFRQNQALENKVYLFLKCEFYRD